MSINGSLIVSPLKLTPMALVRSGFVSTPMAPHPLLFIGPSSVPVSPGSIVMIGTTQAPMIDMSTSMATNGSSIIPLMIGNSSCQHHPISSPFPKLHPHHANLPPSHGPLDHVVNTTSMLSQLMVLHGSVSPLINLTPVGNNINPHFQHTMSWLDQLEVGSLVIVDDPPAEPQLMTVEYITPSRKYIAVGIKIFSGKTGYATKNNARLLPHDH